MKKFIKGLIRSYNLEISLRLKLLISHMTLIIIPTLVLTFFLYNQLYEIIVTDPVLSEQALTEQTASTIEATLAQITYASNSVVDNKYLYDLFHVTKEQASHGSISDARTKEFYDYVQSLVDHSLITAIRIYVDTPYNDLCDKKSSGEKLYQKMDEIYGTYWYGIFNSKNISSLLCPSLYLSPSEMKENGELAYVNKINYSNKEACAAFVVIYFSQDKIDAILKQNISIANGATYIVNERDALVSASNKALSGAYFMTNEELKKTMRNAKKFSTRTYLGESYYVGYYTIEKTDWSLVSILPVKNLTRKGKLIVYVFLGLYLIFTFIALILSMLLSNSIVRRISTVVEQMKSVRHGKAVRIELKEISRDEVGTLIDTYNYMTDELNLLLEEQKKAAEELRISEFKALQSQINPHFLYNSLDMINWMSQSGRPEEVKNAVQALAKFYKLSLSKKDTSTTIGMELEHASLYIRIQNMRYENRIEFLADVTDELMDYEIPKLTLQPIVENSIQHGIMEKDNKRGTIIITGWKEADTIVLLVSDDGVGMDEFCLSRILNGETKKKNGNNIGIYNTHSRLQLFYGIQYGLRYESTLGSGTEVEIRIPALIKDKI